MAGGFGIECVAEDLGGERAVRRFSEANAGGCPRALDGEGHVQVSRLGRVWMARWGEAAPESGGGFEGERAAGFECECGGGGFHDKSGAHATCWLGRSWANSST